MECPYEKDSKILEYFERSPSFSATDLEFASYELETPDNAKDKEMFKELKSSHKNSKLKT